MTYTTAATKMASLIKTYTFIHPRTFTIAIINLKQRSWDLTRQYYVSNYPIYH
jgi:hypothetical protein